MTTKPYIARAAEDACNLALLGLWLWLAAEAVIYAFATGAVLTDLLWSFLSPF